MSKRDDSKFAWFIKVSSWKKNWLDFKSLNLLNPKIFVYLLKWVKPQVDLMVKCLNNNIYICWFFCLNFDGEWLIAVTTLDVFLFSERKVNPCWRSKASPPQARCLWAFWQKEERESRMVSGSPAQGQPATMTTRATCQSVCLSVILSNSVNRLLVPFSVQTPFRFHFHLLTTSSKNCVS